MDTDDLNNAAVSASIEVSNPSESQPKQETEPPGEITGEPESIDQIKGRLFSCPRTDGEVNLQNAENLFNRSEGSLAESNRNDNAIDGNTEEGMRNIQVHQTVDCESFPSYENTQLGGSGYPVTDNVPHNQAFITRAYFQRTSSGGSSCSRVSDPLECDNCELLRARFPARESIDFWDKVECYGNARRCHSKFGIKFLAKLKEEFPCEDGLKSKQTISLLQTLLGVESKDDAEVSLSDFLNIVRFFGPVKTDSDGRCLLIQHLHEIIKKSVLKGKQYQKVSWFAGKKSRDEANELLQHQSENTYLVRMSQSSSESGSFVVSVKTENGCHHFEIEGNPLESATSPALNCHLRFMGKSYKTLPEAIEVLKRHPLRDEDNDEDIWCTRICPDLPLNKIVTPYKRTK